LVIAGTFGHQACSQTSACHPAAHGAAERLVGSFKSMLECHVNSQLTGCRLFLYYDSSTLSILLQEMVFGRLSVPVLRLARDVLAVAASDMASAGVVSM
jgi:hypothetical protein